MSFVEITSQFERKDALIPEEQINESPPPLFDKIFSDYIYKQTPIDVSRHPVGEILNYKIRKKSDKSEQEKISRRVGATVKFFRWDDFPSKGSKYPRYFGIYVSPHLKLLIKEGLKSIPVHIYLHPIGDIYENESQYYKGSHIYKYYRDVAIHYLLNDHRLGHLHRYSVSNESDLNNSFFNKPVCLIFPVFSGTAFSSFPNYDSLHFLQIIDSLIKEAIPAFFPLGTFNSMQFSLGRIAISAFSVGGEMLKRLFVNPRDDVLKKINEVYTFDITLDKPGTPRLEANDKFWSKLKIWQGDDSDKMIRMYSAESGTMANIADELKNNLKKYGGGKYIEGNFIKYNEKKIGDYLFKNLGNGFELHSTDNSRILFILPIQTFSSYYHTENQNGLTGLWEGHAWFSRSFITHALFHSGF